MTLTFDLKTWFKVTVTPLLNGTMWVKYEPDKPKGEKICFGHVILDGWTDGLITTGRPLFSSMEYNKQRTHGVFS